MDDLRSVQLIDSSAHLLHIVGDLNFWEGLTPLQLLKKLTSHRNFQNDVDVFLIIETPIKLDYIWVIQIHLYFYLSSKLLDDSFLSYNGFFYDLKGYSKT